MDKQLGRPPGAKNKSTLEQVDASAERVQEQQSPNDDLTALKSELAKRDEQIESLQTENKSLAEDSGSTPGTFPRSMATTRNKPTYKFAVSAHNNPKLPRLVILAVDESEAIRLYILRASPGKALDSTKISWRVESLQEAKRRQNSVKAKAARREASGLPVPESMTAERP